MNILRIKYYGGFYLMMKDSERKPERYIHIPKNIYYCCEDFSFSSVGLELTWEETFVLKAIFEKKKSSKRSGVWEEIDFGKNVCCFINTGNIPYANEVYFVVEDANGDVVDSYPVALFNVNGNFIGFVNDKATLISTWNADPANVAIGQIEDIGQDFIFKFIPV